MGPRPQTNTPTAGLPLASGCGRRFGSMGENRKVEAEEPVKDAPTA
jgi:hypothetical protein